MITSHSHAPPYETLTNICCLPEPFLRICPWGESNLQGGTTLLCVIVRGGGSGVLCFSTPRTAFHPFCEQIFRCTALHYTIDIFLQNLQLSTSLDVYVNTTTWALTCFADQSNLPATQIYRVWDMLSNEAQVQHF